MPPNLNPSIAGCIANGKRLTEDAQLLHEFDRFPSAQSLAILAQEEFAKAFLLVLVSKAIIPWTEECKRALRSHECKHLAGVMIEWLGPPLEEALAHCNAGGQGRQLNNVPADVAVAINIVRHEKFERFRSGYAARHPEDDGPSRRIADGLLDLIKQQGLYVGLNGGRIDPRFAFRVCPASRPEG